MTCFIKIPFPIHSRHLKWTAQDTRDFPHKVQLLSTALNHGPSNTGNPGPPPISFSSSNVTSIKKSLPHYSKVRPLDAPPLCVLSPCAHLYYNASENIFKCLYFQRHSISNGLTVVYDGSKEKRNKQKEKLCLFLPKVTLIYKNVGFFSISCF